MLICIIFSLSFSNVAVNGQTWNSHGGNLNNDRFLRDTAFIENGIQLETPTFEVNIGTSTSATPAVLGDTIFFPSWNGNVYCVNTKNGQVVWSKNINNDYYDGTKSSAYSRSTPVINGNEIIFFIQFPADIVVVNKKTGEMQWKLNLDPHVAAVLTQSGNVYGNDLYQGISSLEEGFAANPNYPCCSFVGSFVKVDLKKKEILWRFKTIPDSISGIGMFSGNAVWGSSPPIDISTKTVYIATGNNYEADPAYLECIDNNDPEDWEAVCNNVGDRAFNYFNAVIALDTDTGAVKWAKKVDGFDAWTVACPPFFPPEANPNCPDTFGPDWDFGMAPILSRDSNGNKRLYIAQKSGVVWCFDAENGNIIWSTQASPGGVLGGTNWGAATDDKRVYIGVINSFGLDWTLKNGSVVNGGGWAALDKQTGEIVWTTANPAAFDPSGGYRDPVSNGRSTYAYGAGPPTVIDNTVLVGSTDCIYSPDLGTGSPVSGSGGYVYALNSTTGEIISSYETGASVYGGFSGDSKCVYIGSGYRPDFGMSAGTSVFAWCINQDI